MGRTLWAGVSGCLGWLGVCVCLLGAAGAWTWRGSGMVYEKFGFFQRRSSWFAGWLLGYEEADLGDFAICRYASATMYQALPFTDGRFHEWNYGRLRDDAKCNVNGR